MNAADAKESGQTALFCRRARGPSVEGIRRYTTVQLHAPASKHPLKLEQLTAPEKIGQMLTLLQHLFHVGQIHK